MARPKTTPGQGTIRMRPGHQASATTVRPKGGAPMPDSGPPEMPSPRYVVGAEIARGGMGRVVEAVDTMLGRVVAVKEALATDADALQRFARETRITARLEHPSIVPVHDAGTSSTGAPFYVMRKVSGLPLETLVLTLDTLGQRLALVPHIVAAANAVAHAHERHIIHRDIKPANILVGDLGETVVIDWGLAKVIGEPDELPHAASAGDDTMQTRAGIVFGTPGFMAPEQLRGEPADERCDVYALGASLYHVLARKPPHHATRAAAMNEAAVQASPPPIRDVVDGVPPELSTIVDKALAFDPAARYQHARALAEDLDRFLTGQLVASHHYSAAARVARFVRRHRVAVITATAAAVALIVIGALAVSRIVDARDRETAAASAAREDKRLAEVARGQAEDRLDKLTLTQARFEVGSNPTLAVAMVKPLAQTHWREVRAIAAAARAAGVAWSLPGPKVTRSLELSRDGLHAVGAGGDGSVRLYDFEHRTVKTLLTTQGPMTARYADDERRVVAWHGSHVAIADIATGALRELVVPSVIDALEVVGITAYYVDHGGALWQLDLAGVAPLQLAVDEQVRALSPSPDGRWLALTGETHLLLYDRTQPALPALVVVPGNAIQLAWAADGGHLAALVDDQVVELAIAPSPTVIHRATIGKRAFVAYSAGRVFTIGPTGVGVVTRGEPANRKALASPGIGLVETRGDTVLAASHDRIAVLADDGDLQLTTPARILGIHASPRSPYVVATVEDRLLVWNLDDLQPRRLTTQAPALASFVGSDSVIASFVDGPTRWLDVATGRDTALGQWPALRQVAAAPGGRLAAIIDLTHHVHLVAPGRDVQTLASDVDLAGFASDHELLISTDAGTIQLHDTLLHHTIDLVPHASKARGIGWSRTSPAWVAAVFDDGTLWRKNLATGVEATIANPLHPTSAPLIGADGSLVFAHGNELRVWRADGTLASQTTFDQPIVRLGAAGAGGAVVFTDGRVYAVDLAQPGKATPWMPIDDPRASLSALTGLVVVKTHGGELDVIDPVVGQRWALSAPGVTYDNPQLAEDGRRVLAQAGKSLLVWSLDLPATPAATATWLDSLTNAIQDRSSGELGWPSR